MVAYGPTFCDITWGAGGSTAEVTLGIATKMQNLVRSVGRARGAGQKGGGGGGGHGGRLCRRANSQGGAPLVSCHPRLAPLALTGG
jgi:hypothetical protein